MRWSHVKRGTSYRYGPDTVALLSTPLYSNTTLVVFFPTLAWGGTVILMPKFDAAGYLKIALVGLDRVSAPPSALAPAAGAPAAGVLAVDAADANATAAAPVAAVGRSAVAAFQPAGRIRLATTGMRRVAKPAGYIDTDSHCRLSISGVKTMRP